MARGRLVAFELIPVEPGIQLIMYSYCALYLWGQRRAKKVSLYFLAYITLLFSVETIFVIVQARSVQLMYIDNRSYPGGPWQYFLATQSLAINVVFYATLFLLTSLSDILVVCSESIPSYFIVVDSELSFGGVGPSGPPQGGESSPFWL